MFNFRLTPATDSHRSPITTFSNARPLLNAATAHLCHRFRNVATHTCRLNTLLATQFLVGTFVLTKGHFSTPLQEFSAKLNILNSQLLWRVIMKGWQKETTRNTGSDGPVGYLGWLSLNSNKLTTYLLGVQDGARDMTSYTWPTLKTDTRGAQIQRVKWPGLPNFVRWHLPFVGPEYGTWFMSLTWDLEF